jgi:predicted ATPase
VHGDSLQTKLDKLGALLAKTSTSEQDLPLFAELLSLPNDGRFPTSGLDAQQRRQKTLDALLAQIVTLSREQPVLILFEDTHWIDPTTLELIGRTVDRIRDCRVLLIATFRPEFEPPWTGRPHVTMLTLNRLVQRDVDAMIDRIVGNKFIPTGIRQDIIERADGIPLFVEELTRAVLEAATEGEARQTVAATPSPLVAVPATLQASLMARLDRLGPAKEIAQMGAAIGREFSHALIAAVARKSETELGETLDRIIAAGLLFRQGMPPHANYLFKHALVQDAAYGTLLREPRRALHARIVEALESQFAEIVERQPELLARHCGDAGLIEKAALLWGRAGQRSLERAAVAEAVEQLTRALSQITTLPATPVLRRERIKFQVAIASALMHVKGYAASETRGALDQARALIEEAEARGEALDDPLLLFSVLYGLWVANYNTFDGNSVRERAGQFLAAAARQGTTVPLMVGCRLMGISLAHTGDLVAGRAHLDDARSLYNAAEHRSLATRFGQDIGIGILFQRALPRWMLGYPQAALADCDQAMSDARDLGLATTLMPALLFTSVIHILCGHDARANEQANELVALADDKHSALWKAFGVLLQGVVSAVAGRPSEAGQTISVGIGALRATGSTLCMPLWSSYLAKSHAALGQFFDAWRSMGEAMTIIETSKESLFEPEVDRMAGELALTAPAPDVAKAEMYFQRALSISRAQQAKSWELRAAMSLARLWCDQGAYNNAYELLAPVYRWFTEGLDTRDLKEAKGLLEVCRSA